MIAYLEDRPAKVGKFVNPLINKCGVQPLALGNDSERRLGNASTRGRFLLLLVICDHQVNGEYCHLCRRAARIDHLHRGYFFLEVAVRSVGGGWNPPSARSIYTSVY